jgi:serine/threonine protein kinase
MSSSLGRLTNDELEERIHQLSYEKVADTMSHYADTALEKNIPSYAFPVSRLSIARQRTGKLTIGQFTDVQHLAFGSNAEVSKAKLAGDTVCIKMIKKDKVDNDVAKKEFDTECGILLRLNHPNILTLYGYGTEPHRFLVIEFLSGGTLTDKLKAKMRRSSVFNALFPKAKFPLPEVYRMFIQLADAFDYLHRRMHPDATIIHRDLKPDNVGFTADGNLLLFDFGLCTCVKRFTSPTSVYEMTGGTGSLRYMAPEVALELPYNEKVDVYSCGILLWQVASDQQPFAGATRKDFMKFIVQQGCRPDVKSSWPKALKKLMTDMWDPDPTTRPSFDAVLNTLRVLAGMEAIHHSAVV